MTGTDAVSGVVTGGIGLHRTALKYTLGIFDGTSGNGKESLEMKQTGAVLHRSASSCTSEGAGDRTQDPQIKSLTVPNHNVLQDNTLQQQPTIGRSAGRSDDESEGGNDDPDLSRLVAAWPTLAEPLKAAIRAMIASATGSLDGK